ncbi:MAG: hypothetical protein R6V56_09325 [Lentisphaeria bacterium]
MFYLSKVDTISASLVRIFGFANARGWIALITLSLGFLMLRFWGQGMLLLESTAGYLMVIAGNGIAGGTFGLLMTVTWPRFYGRKHLGAISGFHMSWVVAFSAVGPSFFGIFFAFIHSYKPAVGLCLIVLGGLFYLALRTEDPRKADSH